MNDITGTTLEIRITDIKPGQVRWLLCAVEGDQRIKPRERHTWGGIVATERAALDAALAQRRLVTEAAQ